MNEREDIISLTCYINGPDFVMAIMNGFDRAMVILMGCMFSSHHMDEPSAT